MRTVVLIVALIACAAFAQPFANVPLIPLSGFIQGNGYNPVVPAVPAGMGWVFTADNYGVFAMNKTAPTNTVPTFYIPLPGITNMWFLGTWRNMSTSSVVAIAGPTIAQFRFNATMVWLAQTFTAPNATFNFQTPWYPSSPSYNGPGYVANPNGGYMMVLGTRNTSNVASGVALPSTVYAFDINTLLPVWQTVMNSDTTNFGMTNCSMFVWLLAQNTTYSNSRLTVQRLYINNGSLDTSFPRVKLDSSSFGYISLAYTSFIAFTSGGYYYIGALNGTITQYSLTYSCNAMPFSPVLLNNSWFFTCDSMFYVINNQTGAVTASKYASGTIYCGAAHEYNNDVVFVGGQTVYVYNATGLFTLMTLPSSSYSYTCTGASFDYIFGTNSPFPLYITDTLHLSLANGGSGGQVIGLNYRNAQVYNQIATEISPYGPVFTDLYIGKIFIASTNGPILESYDLTPFWNVNQSMGYMTKIPSSSPATFAFAFNATNMSSYYIDASSYYGPNIYTVDNKGNVALMVPLTSSSMYDVQMQPILVGQYLVFVDYYNKLWVIDSVAKTGQSVSVCSQSNRVNPVVSGTKVFLTCNGGYYGGTAANAVDVSASTLSADTVYTPSSSSSYPPNFAGVVIGKTFLVPTSYSEVRGFDITKLPATALWSTTPKGTSTYGIISTIVSNLVTINGLAYVVATPMVTIGNTDYTPYLMSISPSSGTVSKIVRLGTNTDTSTKTLLYKTGGVFGNGIVYVIGYNNITAYDMSWNLKFTYKHNSSSINSRMGGSPVVLDNSGAICFYDYNGYFNVVGGFQGALAWRYKATSSANYPVLTDNTSVFFTDGTAVIGADIYNGGLTSISTYQNGQVQGYGLMPRPMGFNVSLVLGVTNNQIVFANLVSLSNNTKGVFPGAGGSSGGSSTLLEIIEKNKAYIAGIVVGVIVVIAVVVFIAKKSGGSSTTDENYVPMNPATQV